MIRFDWRQFARATFDWRGRVQNGLLAMGFSGSFQGNLFLNGETGVQYEHIYEDEFGAAERGRFGRRICSTLRTAGLSALL